MAFGEPPIIIAIVYPWEKGWLAIGWDGSDVLIVATSEEDMQLLSREFKMFLKQEP